VWVCFAHTEVDVQIRTIQNATEKTIGYSKKTEKNYKIYKLPYRIMKASFEAMPDLMPQNNVRGPSGGINCAMLCSDVPNGTGQNRRL
jgi:hypothetical protein